MSRSVPLTSVSVMRLDVDRSAQGRKSPLGHAFGEGRVRMDRLLQLLDGLDVELVVQRLDLLGAEPRQLGEGGKPGRE